MSGRRDVRRSLTYRGPRWPAGIYNPFSGRCCSPWWQRVIGVLGVVPFAATYGWATWTFVEAAQKGEVADRLLAMVIAGAGATVALVAMFSPWGRFAVAIATILGIAAHVLGLWSIAVPELPGFDIRVSVDAELWETALIALSAIPIAHATSFAWRVIRVLGTRPLPSFARFGSVFGRRLSVQRQAAGPMGYLAVLEDRYLTDKIVTLRLGPDRSGIRIGAGRPRDDVLGLSQQGESVALGHDEAKWIRGGRLDSCARLALLQQFEPAGDAALARLRWQGVGELPMRDLFEEDQIHYAKRYVENARRSEPVAVLIRQVQGAGAETAIVVRRPSGRHVVEYPFEHTAIAVEQATDGLEVQIDFVAGDTLAFAVSPDAATVAVRRAEGLLEYHVWVTFE